MATLPAPESVTSTAEAKGIPVHFSAGAPYYAAIIRHKVWKRTLLYIYDAQNQVVYDEVLDQDCGAVQTIKNAAGGEDLLLGCDNNIAKYSFIPSTRNAN